MAISLHYAIRVSRLTSQLKYLAQKVALLEHATRERVLDEASTR